VSRSFPAVSIMLSRTSKLRRLPGFIETGAGSGLLSCGAKGAKTAALASAGKALGAVWMEWTGGPGV